MSIVAETVTVAWDYTMADVDRMARKIAKFTYYVNSFVPYDDRVEDAWYGIVECLYAAGTEAPSTGELIEAGARAVRAQSDQRVQSHGIAGRPGYGTAERIAGFDKYWRRVASVEEDFTDRIAERLALPQMLALLEDDEYEVLMAKATLGSERAAMTSLGMTRSTFQRRLASARSKMIAAWVSPETPRKRVMPGDDRCAAGHLKETHGFQLDGYGWRCRICLRNDQRRWKARNRV